MRTVTSFGTHVTSEGTRISITYSEISDAGEIIKSNEKINRIIMDEKVQEHITAINEYAQTIIDSIE